jgi:hypothetical protein
MALSFRRFSCPRQSTKSRAAFVLLGSALEVIQKVTIQRRAFRAGTGYQGRERFDNEPVLLGKNIMELRSARRANTRVVRRSRKAAQNRLRAHRQKAELQKGILGLVEKSRD